MPQLGPINWLFLYIFFWAVVGIIFVVVWWDGRKGYKISGAKKSVSDYIWKW
uniref:ATP synthase complex subunit 8 n=1 Tax=Patella vulgata TaxID=6465 RepID=A0A481MVK4_PATVU|nr:ATP synthase F0 subunit 8 [Patella vulgata]